MKLAHLSLLSWMQGAECAWPYHEDWMSWPHLVGQFMCLPAFDLSGDEVAP